VERFGTLRRHGDVTLSCERKAVTVGESTPETFEGFDARALLPAARLAHLLTGSAAIGHDVAQESLVALHARWDEIDNPDAYLRVVVVNRCRSVQRRRGRERSFLARARVEPVTAIPELDETWHAVRRLPTKQRAIVVLRFYEDLSVPEIAAALELAEGTVKSTLHRALRQLKELLT
jgi:RNA polymerase sigma-70 factor (ECF subfamily)